MKYDFLIVGAGLFGSVCARELTDKGYTCIVIDKRHHIGGSCYTTLIDGIHVHVYGPHVFHTKSDRVWEYVNRFTEFENYVHVVKACYNNQIYSFPININTLNELYGIDNKEDAEKYFSSVRTDIKTPKNIEEWCIANIGEDLYNIFIKGYTRKQWNTDPKNLPTSIIKRVPIRLSTDDRYFGDDHQGIPKNGYTDMFQSILEGINVETGVDFFGEQGRELRTHSDIIIYGGQIDKFYDYAFGKLQYRSLAFESEIMNIPELNGRAVTNYPGIDHPYTRITEHKFFQTIRPENITIVTKEYPADFDGEGDSFYPINDNKNTKIYNRYREYGKLTPNVVFGGWMGNYQYYNMDQAVANALTVADKYDRKQ